MKKTPFFSLFFLIALFFLNAPNAFAAQIQTGLEIYSNQQIIADNFYVAGGNVLLNNEFNQDVVVVGGEVVIDGLVKGDATILGGNSNILGEIQGDLRIIGGEINLQGKVSGDLVIFGGVVNLVEGAEILGESILVGVEINQNSYLQNKLKVVAGKINLNGEVNTEIEAMTQRMTFGSNAKILGSLKYYAPFRAEQISGAEVSGNVIFNEIQTIRETGVVKSTILNLLTFWIILRFITTLIVAFLLIYIFRVFTQETNDLAISSFLKCLLYGLLSLFVIPLIILILFISLVASPIGFLILLVYLFIFIIAPSISGIFIGTIISRLLKKEKENNVSFSNATIGIVFLTLLQFIPYVGNLIRFIFTLVAVGAICKYLYLGILKK